MLFLFLIPQLVSVVTANNVTGSHSSNGDVPYRRNVKYFGGEYNTTATGSFLINSIYVEELLPAKGASEPNPVVFFPGGFDAGTQWITKPDGNAGWASFFLKKGHAVYLVDPYSVGRSSYSTPQQFIPVSNTDLVESGFTSPEKSKFAAYYQKKFHNQWPGTGQKGDPIFDRFYASLLPGAYGPASQTAMQKAGCALLASLNAPAILVSHSIGASPAFLTTDKCPEKVKAHISTEGDTSPFASNSVASGGLANPIRSRPYGLSDIPLNYDPPISGATDLLPVQNGTNEYTDGLLSKYQCFTQGAAVENNGTAAIGTGPGVGTVHKLPNIAKAPVLQLTGQGSVHAIYDQCLVQYLQLTGVTVTWAQLVNEGILGNGHFMMLEKNSDQIAEFAYKWIKRLGNKRRSATVETFRA